MYGIFTYMYHRNQPNVGKYTIHGWYGIHTIHWSYGGNMIQFQPLCLCGCFQSPKGTLDTFSPNHLPLSQFGWRNIYLELHFQPFFSGWKWWNNNFSCKDLESSNWNNHLKVDVSGSRYIFLTQTHYPLVNIAGWKMPSFQISIYPKNRNLKSLGCLYFAVFFLGSKYQM